jgi:hypothetical protein
VDLGAFLVSACTESGPPHDPIAIAIFLATTLGSGLVVAAFLVPTCSAPDLPPPKLRAYSAAVLLEACCSADEGSEMELPSLWITPSSSRRG